VISFSSSFAILDYGATDKDVAFPGGVLADKV
jgi:hypothetical protein